MYWAAKSAVLRFVIPTVVKTAYSSMDCGRNSVALRFIDNSVWGYVLFIGVKTVLVFWTVVETSHKGRLWKWCDGFLYCQRLKQGGALFYGRYWKLCCALRHERW
jgi:hypothetical protein